MKKLIIIILFFPTLLLSQVYEGYKDFDSLKFGIDGTVQTTAFTEDTVNSIIVDTVTTMITDSIDVMQTELDDTVSDLRTDLLRKDALSDSLENQDTIYSSVAQFDTVIIYLLRDTLRIRNNGVDSTIYEIIEARGGGGSGTLTTNGVQQYGIAYFDTDTTKLKSDSVNVRMKGDTLFVDSMEVNYIYLNGEDITGRMVRFDDSSLVYNNIGTIKGSYNIFFGLENVNSTSNTNDNTIFGYRNIFSSTGQVAYNLFSGPQNAYWSTGNITYNLFSGYRNAFLSIGDIGYNLFSGYQNAYSTLGNVNYNLFSGFRNAYAATGSVNYNSFVGYLNANAALVNVYYNNITGYQNAYSATGSVSYNNIIGDGNVNSALNDISYNNITGYQNAYSATGTVYYNFMTGRQNANSATGNILNSLLVGYRNANTATTVTNTIALGGQVYMNSAIDLTDAIGIGYQAGMGTSYVGCALFGTLSQPYANNQIVLGSDSYTGGILVPLANSSTSLTPTNLLITNPNATTNNFSDISFCQSLSDPTIASSIYVKNISRVGASEKSQFLFYTYDAGQKLTALYDNDSTNMYIDGNKKMWLNSLGLHLADTLFLGASTVKIVEDDDDLIIETDTLEVSGVIKDANGILTNCGLSVWATSSNDIDSENLFTTITAYSSLSGTTWKWTGGTITDDEAKSTTAFSVAQYQLVGTNGSCTDTAFVTVNGNTIIQDYSDSRTRIENGRVIIEDTLMLGSTEPDTLIHSGNKLIGTDTLQRPAFEVGLSSVMLTASEDNLLQVNDTTLPDYINEYVGINKTDTYYKTIGFPSFTSDPDKDFSYSTTPYIKADADNIAFYVSVQLPDNCEVVSCVVYGNTNAAAETYTLRRVNSSGGGNNDLASDNINTVDNTINASYKNIDNENYMYYIYTTTLDTDDQIFWARIGFKYL